MERPVSNEQKNNPWYATKAGKTGMVVFGVLLLFGLSAVRDAVVESPYADFDITLDDIKRAKTDSPYEVADIPKTITYNVENNIAPALGSDAAPITIVAFMDFGCPYCRSASSLFSHARLQYPDDVRIMFRHYPINEGTDRAAEASMCAHEQNAFWAFQELLFTQPTTDPDVLKTYGAMFVDDVNAFNACVDERTYRLDVQQDVKEAVEAGITGTPTFFVNGRKIEGNVPIPVWDQIISNLKAEFE